MKLMCELRYEYLAELHGNTFISYIDYCQRNDLDCMNENNFDKYWKENVK